MNFATEQNEWQARQALPDFTDKDYHPPNRPDLNLLDYHVWEAIMEKFQELKPNPHNVTEIKVALQTGMMKQFANLF